VTGKIIGGAHMVSSLPARVRTVWFGDRAGAEGLIQQPRLPRKMPDDIDISAGDILEGTKSLPQVGEELVDLVMRTARGEPAKAEYFQIKNSRSPMSACCARNVIHAEYGQAQRSEVHCSETRIHVC